MLDAHPAVFAPLAERIDYAMVVGMLVSADGEVTDEEMAGLRELCHDIAIPPRHTDPIFDFARAPTEDRLQAALRRLRESDLRYALVRDMVALGFADGRYDVQERRQVRGLSAMLLVGEDDVRRIEDEVVAELHGEPDPTVSAARPESFAERLARAASFDSVKRLYQRVLGTQDDAQG